MSNKCLFCGTPLPINKVIPYCAACVVLMLNTPAYKFGGAPHCHNCGSTSPPFYKQTNGETLCDACEIQRVRAIPSTKCIYCGVYLPLGTVVSYCNRCSQKGGGSQVPPSGRSSRFASSYGYASQSSQQTGPASVKCRIWWVVKTQSYNISTPFNKQFVELIKMSIPIGQRDYDENTKIWTFTEEHFEKMRDVAKMIWKLPGEVVIESKQDAEDAEAKKRAEAATHVHKAPIASVLNDFLMLLPNDALVAAYRRAAMELHPDKQGGSSEKMSHLNTLWERIKVEKGI